VKRILYNLERILAAAETVRAETVADGNEAATGDVDKISSAAQKLRQYIESFGMEAGNLVDVATLRHKLRTPINQVLGYCELMLEEAEDATSTPWQSELETIHSHARLLTGLIDELIEEVQTGPVPIYRPRTNQPTAEQRAAATTVILVVDDNATNRDMLARRLKRDGHFVFEAGNGRDALDTAGNVGIDLVLLDIMMPVMDGYETLAAFKADEKLRHIPMIMLTSLDEPDAITRCIELGAEDHLPKPFDPVLLRARISACLEKKELHDREVSYRQRIQREKTRADALLNVVIPLGVALSSESEYDRMLERIVTETRELCHADGGALFLRHEDTLKLVFLECESLDLRHRGEADGPVQGPPVSLSDGANEPDPIVRAVVQAQCQNVPDLDAVPEMASARLRQFDAAHGYHTQSVLAVPLRSNDEIIGVLQLYNARDMEHGTIAGFDEGLVQLVMSMSSLAGAALASYSRMQTLKQRIEKLEIQIDEQKRQEQVAEITETEYFRKLRDKARSLRKGSA
jgi:CheY-like chemotaxis protein